MKRKHEQNKYLKCSKRTLIGPHSFKVLENLKCISENYKFSGQIIIFPSHNPLYIYFLNILFVVTVIFV